MKPAMSMYVNDADYRKALDEWQKARIQELEQQRDELLAALKALFDDYKQGADSGDWGNWKLEDIPVGQQALAAIAKAAGGQA